MGLGFSLSLNDESAYPHDRTKFNGGGVSLKRMCASRPEMIVKGTEQPRAPLICVDIASLRMSTYRDRRTLLRQAPGSL